MTGQNNTDNIDPTEDGSCQKYVANVVNGPPNLRFESAGGGFCNLTYNADNSGRVRIPQYPVPGACPASSVENASGSCDCADGYVAKGNQCVPDTDSCKARAGKRSSTNYTAGWTRNNPATNDDDGVARGIVGTISWPEGTTMCVAGCLSAIGGMTPGSNGWASTSASPNGLYRLSGDFETTVLPSGMGQPGGACTMDPQANNNPSAPMLPCDGSLGTVNGETKCLAPANEAAGTHTKAKQLLGDGKQGNPAAGSDGAKGIGDPTRSPSAGSSTGGSASEGGSQPSGNGGNGGGPPRSTDGQRLGSGAGSPQGAASGSGNGTSGKNEAGGPCVDNPAAAGCGGKVSGVTASYSAKGKKMEDVVTAFRDRIAASPIGTATGGFFAVSGTGRCPTFSFANPFGGAALVVDQFCGPAANNALAILKVVVLILASILAFRIAIDN